MPKHVIDYRGAAARAAFIAGVECEALHAAMADPGYGSLAASTRSKVLRAWTMWDAFRRERVW